MNHVNPTVVEQNESRQIRCEEPVWGKVLFPPILNETLDPSWDLGVSAQHIVLSHFSEVLRWREHVWQNTDVEAVHQIRVSARRCRTALQTFAVLWPGREYKMFSRYIATFADAFGTARDLDVMLIWLNEQVATTSTDRAAAYRWLIERNSERRMLEQPRLERCLLKFESDGFAAAFASYFSRLPQDLWELSPVGSEAANG
jgi:CHAD domain-containing protein